MHSHRHRHRHRHRGKGPATHHVGTQAHGHGRPQTTEALTRAGVRGGDGAVKVSYDLQLIKASIGDALQLCLEGLGVTDQDALTTNAPQTNNTNN